MKHAKQESGPQSPPPQEENDPDLERKFADYVMATGRVAINEPGDIQAVPRAES